ncbi:YggS family pyridoxal phosphate-dependent enzyme [Streptomyces triculaminicus]|uniref:YggS family pyridoxal phosphate-dependent enzyme n=1 Tax=Streptomyces triculaminicus TaxID=2816232 RepID=UPI0037D27383
MTAIPETPHRPDPTIGLSAVRDAIEGACTRVGRDPRSVTLVAASKTVPADVLERAAAAGLTVFGENRVQEAKTKWPALRERIPGLELHLIGPLQTNKAREAVALFDVIQSVDRPGLCEALARQCDRQGRRPRLFVQVNTGAEPQKAGVLPELADDFLTACRQTYGLDVAGLMCVPPADTDPAPHFTLLAGIAARNGLPGLSMGMSTDFAEAIAHGATHVRVGSAIFGARARVRRDVI